MPDRDSDSIVWIGYADFLTTLAILFFVLLVVQFTTGSAVLAGRITEDGRLGVSGCVVRGLLADEAAVEQEVRIERTDEGGQFLWEFDALRDSVKLRVEASCDTFPTRDTLVALYRGARIRLNLPLNPDTSRLAGDSSTVIIALEGEALFETNTWRLRQEGVESIRRVGRELRGQLEAGGILAIQGHTDSVPFPPGSDMDNWRLSVMRAAAAAKVLRDWEHEIGIPECRMVVMGFGPTRPSDEIVDTDPPSVKRSKNRRIEFRLLRGADLTGRETAGC